MGKERKALAERSKQMMIEAISGDCCCEDKTRKGEEKR